MPSIKPPDQTIETQNPSTKNCTILITRSTSNPLKASPTDQWLNWKKKRKPFSFINLGPYNYKLQNLTKQHRQRKANSLNRPQVTNSIPKKMKPKQQLSSTNDKSNLIWSGNRVVVIIDVCGTGRLWSEGRLDSTNPWGFVELPGGYDGAKGAHVLDSLCSSKKRETKLIENLFFSFLKNKKVKILLLFY